MRVCFFSVEGPVTKRDNPLDQTYGDKRTPTAHTKRNKNLTLKAAPTSRNSWQLTQNSADTQTNRSTQERQQKQTYRPPNDLLTTEHRTPAMQESREICSSFPFRSRLLFSFSFSLFDGSQMWPYFSLRNCGRCMLRAIFRKPLRSFMTSPPRRGDVNANGDGDGEHWTFRGGRSLSARLNAPSKGRCPFSEARWTLQIRDLGRIDRTGLGFWVLKII